MTVLETFPIFAIKRQEDVFGHLCRTDMAKRIGALNYSVSYLNQFFTSHCMLASTFCLRPQDPLPAPLHATLYGDANNSSMAPLLLTPELGREWLQYLFCQSNWPEIRSILSAPLWFGSDNPFANWRYGQGAKVPLPVHAINAIPFNHKTDLLIHLPAIDLIETLQLHLPHHAWATCLEQNIGVRVIAASMTEAILVREYAALYGYFLTEPVSIPIKTCFDGERSMVPAGYSMELVARIRERSDEAKARFERLHAALQTSEGFFDDALYTGTRSATGAAIYMFQAMMLNLEDGMLYEAQNLDAKEDAWVPVSGPLNLDAFDIDLPMTATPLERWYWALSIHESINPLEE